VSIRTGIGYDSHRFAPGRPFILAGQRIAFDRGLVGHSDADAVAHAVTDAILGAACAGDMGTYFPDTDPQWKDADSLVLLRQAVEHVREAGFRVSHVDVTVILERPRLGVYKRAMAAALAGECGVDPDRVSIKAKTNEGMGFIGREEGIAVLATATLEGA
jgi:2-C-methyl-D-erythritol 2,4-cyclodiphosphate synthase